MILILAGVCTKSLLLNLLRRSSPTSAQGCALATLGKHVSFSNSATLKGVASTLDTNNCSRNSLRVATSLIEPILSPGFQSKRSHPVRAARKGTPAWAEICELLRSNKRSSLALLTFFAKPLAGVCLLVNKKARTAATSLGLTILLTVLWIYQPRLLAAPTDAVALNFFFDTLLFCGAILLLANSIDKEPTVARI